ncbi:hypothetical protein PVAG01_00515 [Phlyctema vagabunda]|uniref:ASX DEUBAD domain-containing protein n=1 Tax=Phlyctema vagabunda TaxID=108571 RepID=A0ABR4PUK2_9HELO
MAKKRGARDINGRAKRAKYNIYDDPEAVMTNSKSPIFEQRISIKSIIQHPKAREILLAKGIDPTFVEQQGFPTSAARYQEDGRAGRFDEEWRRQAKFASKQRADGEFDQYLEEKYERDWYSGDDNDKEAQKTVNGTAPGTPTGQNLGEGQPNSRQQLISGEETKLNVEMSKPEPTPTESVDPPRDNMPCSTH